MGISDGSDRDMADGTRITIIRRAADGATIKRVVPILTRFDKSGSSIVGDMRSPGHHRLQTVSWLNDSDECALMNSADVADSNPEVGRA